MAVTITCTLPGQFSHWWKVASVLLVILEGAASWQDGFISIRGQTPPQSLPITLANNWPVWTLETNNELVQVENSANNGDGWIDPTSFDTVYLPADLPLPLCRPAVGVAVANGVPRYVMPSVVLSLETPERVWRNRGLCSLPRARAWVDLFSPLTPRLEDMRLSIFGRNAPDVRFLEDQDGNEAWDSLITKPICTGDSETGVSSFNAAPQGILGSNGYELLPINQLHDRLQALLASGSCHPALLEGYHFVDIPFDSTAAAIRALPRYELQAFLGDFPDPRRLLALEDPTGSVLEGEPLSQMLIQMKAAAAGRDSEFLPDAYADLYEEGNILML